MFHARMIAAGLLAPAITLAAPASHSQHRARVMQTQPPDARTAGEVDRCLAQHLRVPGNLAEHLPDRTDVWFRVNRAGEVTGVHAPDVATEQIVPYVREALGKCDWRRLAGDEIELKVGFQPEPASIPPP